MKKSNQNCNKRGKNWRIKKMMCLRKNKVAIWDSKQNRSIWTKSSRLWRSLKVTNSVRPSMSTFRNLRERPNWLKRKRKESNKRRRRRWPKRKLRGSRSGKKSRRSKSRWRVRRMRHKLKQLTFPWLMIKNWFRKIMLINNLVDRRKFHLKENSAVVKVGLRKQTTLLLWDL